MTPPPDFPALLARVKAVAGIWDAWCSDDGRIADALHLLADPAPDRAALAAACDLVWDACLMADRASIPYRDEMAPAYRAYQAGWIVFCLLKLRMAPPLSNANARRALVRFLAALEPPL